MSKTDDDILVLTDNVAASKTATDSAITLLQGLSTQLTAALAAAAGAGATPEQLASLEALSTSLQGNTDALAAAVVANTPADTTPPVTPAVAPDGGSTTVPPLAGSTSGISSI